MSNTLTAQKRKKLIPWFNAGPLAPFGEEMESLLSRFVGDSEWVSAMIAPPLDVSESDKEVTVRLDLPGIDPKNVDIKLNNGQLTISGERKEEIEKKGESYHRIERRTGRFSRSVTLPCQVEEDDVDASYKNGVLCIVMPKTFESATRHIAIKSE